MKSVPTSAETARPSKKLTHLEPHSLTDDELLAILLSPGSRPHSVTKLAQSVLTQVDTLGDRLTVADLESVPGMGPAKATQVVAAFELARRRIKPSGVRVSTPEDIANLVRHFGGRKQEHFICISLNGAHEVIATRCITIGLVNCTQVHPREVFADAITDRAASVALAHNHPSGELKPSSNDIVVTRQLIEAGRILGIRVLDHVIVNRRGEFLSLREDGGIAF